MNLQILIYIKKKFVNGFTNPLYLQLASSDDNTDELSFMPMIRFSEWLDEFLCRLFSLLLHLEPSSVT